MQNQSALISFKGTQYQLSLKASREVDGSFLQISPCSLSTSSTTTKRVEYFHEFTPECALLYLYWTYLSPSPTNLTLIWWLYVDVENMTLKTGNFKKFALFVEMLFSGLEKSTNTVSLDILTMKDLQKVGVGSKQGQAAADAGLRDDGVPDSKLYLIVTYTVAFDR